MTTAVLGGATVDRCVNANIRVIPPQTRPLQTRPCIKAKCIIKKDTFQPADLLLYFILFHFPFINFILLTELRVGPVDVDVAVGYYCLVLLTL